MTTWLLEEAASDARPETIQTIVAAGDDDDWEQEAWEQDDTPDWADDEGWDDEDEDEEDEDEDLDEDLDDDLDPDD